jgi:hypothetical protein
VAARWRPDENDELRRLYRGGVPLRAIDAAFIRGGSHLAVLHPREGFAWDVRPRSWANHACAVAGRPLTRPEWSNALPQEDYAPAYVQR